MSRHLLTLVLLLLAASAQGMNRARADANGAGGSCPEAQVTADPADPAAAVVLRTGAAPVAAPAPGKPAGAARAGKAGDRWHSFLPGMFK